MKTFVQADRQRSFLLGDEAENGIVLRVFLFYLVVFYIIC